MSTDAHIPPPGQQHSTHRPLGYYMHNLPPEALLCFGAKQPQRMEVEGAVRWQMGLTLFFAARGRLFLRVRGGCRRACLAGGNGGKGLGGA